MKMATVTMGLSDHLLSREEAGVVFVVRTPNGRTKIGELKISKVVLPLKSGPT
jgi:hypothetical protein